MPTITWKRTNYPREFRVGDYLVRHSGADRTLCQIIRCSGGGCVLISCATGGEFLGAHNLPTLLKWMREDKVADGYHLFEGTITIKGA